MRADAVENMLLQNASRDDVVAAGSFKKILTHYGNCRLCPRSYFRQNLCSALLLMWRVCCASKILPRRSSGPLRFQATTVASELYQRSATPFSSLSWWFLCRGPALLESRIPPTSYITAMALCSSQKCFLNFLQLATTDTRSRRKHSAASQNASIFSAKCPAYMLPSSRGSSSFWRRTAT